MIKRFKRYLRRSLMWSAYGRLKNRLDKEFEFLGVKPLLFINDDDPGPDSKPLVFAYWIENKNHFIWMEFPVSLLIKNENAIFNQIRMKIMFS